MFENNAPIEITYAFARDLQPSEWNSNVVSDDNLAKLKLSKEKLGTFKPIIARRVEGSLQVLGGWHRVLLAEPGEPIPVVDLGEMSDDKAKQIAIADNQRYGNDDPFLFADLVGSLDTSIADLESFLPMSFADISLNMHPVPDWDVSADDEIPNRRTAPEPEGPREPQTHQLLRFLVPIGEAHIITNKIEATIRRLGLEEEHLMASGDALIHIFRGLK